MISGAGKLGALPVLIIYHLSQILDHGMPDQTPKRNNPYTAAKSRDKPPTLLDLMKESESH
jgi:hypothetical protein